MNAEEYFSSAIQKSDSLNKKIEGLKKEINKIEKEKEILAENLYTKFLKHNQNKKVSEIENILDDIFLGRDSINKLKGKVEELYKELFSRIVSKRIKTNIRMDDKSAYLWINHNGIGYIPYWRTRIRNIYGYSALRKCFLNYPGFISYIPNKEKRKIAEYFLDFFKNIHEEKDYESSISIDCNAYIVGKITYDNSIKELLRIKKITLIISKSPWSEIISVRLNGYSDTNTHDIRIAKLEVTYDENHRKYKFLALLSQLSDDELESIKSWLLNIKKIYDSDLKTFSNLCSNLAPYLIGKAI